ncbi:diguanylate cyclase [Marichromatium bheemlicum]|uniref:diguanylate cyclase n=1 Tax=Marichromatium bheemlicum TaxID=365339 RepID=A0ABX1I654_9GAMM|nr:diguanylate cyclase [Marichromatium bheemlicum]NKN32534.1 diguanylate cyclase [Marichromatium bheemlicum]
MNTDGLSNHGPYAYLEGPERPHLLVVEDDPTSLRLIARILEHTYTLTIATNGEDALRLAAERPELILLDYHLPDLDGLEVCRQLQAEPDTAAIPVIYVTANQDTRLEAEALSAGAVDFVVKPYSAAVLRARINTHVLLRRKTALLMQFAERDGLTGVVNRRVFDRQLDHEWRRARRQQLPLSVVMIDADHFKSVNDTWGHLVGDECLRGIARCATMHLRRPADLLARYGGEEFALLLPETDIAGALQLAEAVRDAIQDHFARLVAERGEGPGLTVSLGCAALIPQRQEEDGPERLLRIADRQLYLAKARGRNRVEPVSGD